MVEVNKTLWAPRVKVKKADYEKYIKKLEDTLKVHNDGLVPKIRIKRRHKDLLDEHKKIKRQRNPALGPLFDKQVFIEFENSEYAKTALQRAQGLIFGGMVVFLKWAETNEVWERRSRRRKYRKRRKYKLNDVKRGPRHWKSFNK